MERRDRIILQKVLSEINVAQEMMGHCSLDQFKQAAVASSKNEHTAKDSGYVGFVKKNFALPYGIGMVNGLAELDGKESGYVSSVLHAEKGAYHKFYLVKQVPSQLKPFDRVEAGITNGVKSGLYFDVDSSFVLISKNDKPLFTESDLLELNDKYFKKNLNASNHQGFVNMMADRFAFASAAEERRRFGEARRRRQDVVVIHQVERAVNRGFAVVTDIGEPPVAREGVDEFAVPQRGATGAQSAELAVPVEQFFIFSAPRVAAAVERVAVAFHARLVAVVNAGEAGQGVLHGGGYFEQLDAELALFGAEPLVSLPVAVSAV